jgi:hypothetical protein
MPVRDPESGAMATFDSLAEARRWWHAWHPQEPPLEEEMKCEWCGAYFAPGMQPVIYGGRFYHGVHATLAIASGRRAVAGRR